MCSYFYKYIASYLFRKWNYELGHVMSMIPDVVMNETYNKNVFAFATFHNNSIDLPYRTRKLLALVGNVSFHFRRKFS